MFVGRSGNSATGGVWAFVTDSTGVNKLWEGQFRIPYRTDNGRAPKALSVCATPDTGFTVAGEYNCVDSIGGMNAFAAHFVPAPVVRNVKKTVTPPAAFNVKSAVHGSKVVFYISGNRVTYAEITICNAAGKQVATVLPSGNNEMSWDCRGVAGGVYMFTVKQGRSESFGKSSQSGVLQLLILK